MKVAIQGFQGSFHSIAARSLFGQDIKLIYCKTFKQVFEKLENNEADRAVVAIENSLYGSINEVYDLLLKHHFSICSEIYEQVGLHLVSVEESSLESITDVYSQAPALAESESFLNKNLKDTEIHDHPDTALAAKEVAGWADKTKAAICSIEAANLFDLKILAKNIETHSDNYTRFIALSKTELKIKNPSKTSITLRTADTPGSLYKVLGVFADLGINLSKLESRPIVGDAWRYMYYLDIESGVSEETLVSLKKYASNITVLGSYKTGSLKSI